MRWKYFVTSCYYCLNCNIAKKKRRDGGGKSRYKKYTVFLFHIRSMLKCTLGIDLKNRYFHGVVEILIVD